MIKLISSEVGFGWYADQNELTRGDLAEFPRLPLRASLSRVVMNVSFLAFDILTAVNVEVGCKRTKKKGQRYLYGHWVQAWYKPCDIKRGGTF